MQDLFDSITRAYSKMKSALFSPFSMLLWFTLAFPAWLTELEFGFSVFVQQNPYSRAHLRLQEGHLPRFEDFLPHDISLLILILVVCVLFFFMIAFGILFCWLASRGRFIFFDMLLRGPYEERFGARWSAFKDVANSLFRVRLGFFFLQILCWLVALFFLIPVLIPGINYISGSGAVSCDWLNYSKAEGVLRTFLLAIMILGPLVCFVFAVFLYILQLLFLDYGGILMYQERISGAEAFSRVWNGFKSYPLFFLKYIFGLILINVAAFAVLTLFVLATCLCCCIGYILLVLPYLSAVVRMPIIYTRWQFILEYFNRPELVNIPENTEDSDTIPVES